MTTPGNAGQALTLAVTLARDTEASDTTQQVSIDGPWRRVAGVFYDDGSAYEKWCRSCRDDHGRLTEECEWQVTEDGGAL